MTARRIASAATLSLLLSCEPAFAQGTVWGWGDNTFSQTSTSNGPTPAPIGGLSGVTAIAAGSFHNLALKSDGTVWAWGRNQNGQLGNGTIGTTIFDLSNPTPAQVLNLTRIVAVATGSSSNHNLALRDDGTVWAWGANSNGQLGDGTNVDRPTAFQIAGLTNIVAIAAGAAHSLALRTDGTVWAWGDNEFAELGNGTYYVSGPLTGPPGVYYVPTQVLTGVMTPLGPAVSGPLTDVVAIGAGSYHSLAIQNGGAVLSWGYNGLGQLGNGIDEVTPPYNHAVATPSGFAGVIAIGGGGAHFTVALMNDGSVRTSGYDCEGELGTGDAGCTALLHGVNVPVQVIGIGGVGLLSGVSAISAGGAHVLAVLSDQTVAGWGNDYHAELGSAICTTPVGFFGCSTPVAVNGLSHVVAVAAGGAHSLALVDVNANTDTTPPVVTLAFPTPPAGQDGYFNASQVPVSGSVVATDPSNVAAISCSGAAAGPLVGGGTPSASRSLSVTGDGTHNVSCTATDGANNSGAAGGSANTASIMIDATAPAVVYTGNAGTYTVDQTVNITCTATDALSGLAGSTCQNINAPAYSFPLGTTNVSATATDLAGNHGGGSTSFTVQVTFASLSHLVNQFVTDPSVAGGLTDKLGAASAASQRGNVKTANNQLSAFITQVAAQSGRSLTAAQAALLIQLAQALMQ
jgi:alpha-tubulin suppressor-like RCC1 family protein